MKANILSLVFGMLVLGFEVEAQTNPNLYDMPTAENAIKNIRGADNVDTYAKQRAALYVLWDIAMMQMEKNYQFTDKPIKKIIFNQKQEYTNNMRAVYENYLKEINRPESEEVKENWRQLWVKYYHHTPDFKEEIIENLFNERAKDWYYEVTGYQRPAPTASKKYTGSEDVIEGNAFIENGSLSEGDLLYQTGKKYYYGDGVEKSYEEALGYFSNAATMGNADAQHSLGFMYASGDYVKQDYTEAIKWFNKAEVQNHVGAMNFLGYLYQAGLGVEKDNSKAFNYFKKAADQNDANALYYIGWMYVTDNVAGGSYSKALPYYLSLVNDGIETLSKERRTYVLNKILQIYSYDEKKAALEFSNLARENYPDDIDFEFISYEINLNLRLDNKERSIELLKEASLLQPNNPEIHYNLGVTSTDQGEVSEARTAYKKTIELNPNFINAYLNLSTTYVNEGNDLVEQMNLLGNSQADVARYDTLKRQRNQLFLQGAKVLEDALKINPENRELLDQLKNIQTALK